MTRGMLGSEVGLVTLARSLVPFLTVEALVVGLTLSFPGAVHLLEAPGARLAHTVEPALTQQGRGRKEVARDAAAATAAGTRALVDGRNCRRRAAFAMSVAAVARGRFPPVGVRR
jgi:hypothetical protein